MYSSSEYNSYKRGFVWGWNNGGLGVPCKGDLGVPAEIKALSKFKIRTCAAGGSHSVIVTDDNKVFSVGKNRFGQLGLGDKEDRDEYTQIPPKCFPPNTDPVVQVACGDQFSVCITSSGLVYCWGKNFVGQLGFGHEKGDVLSPKLHESLSQRNIRRIACGSRHSLFLSATGRIFTCGWGQFGQLGLGTYGDELFEKEIDSSKNGGERFEAIEIKAKGCCSIALSSKYEVFMWGGKKFDEEEYEKVARGNRASVPRKLFGNLQGRRIIDIAVASDHGLALTSDGSVYGFGFFLTHLGYTNYIPNILESFRSGKELSETGKMIRDRRLDLSKKFILDGSHGFKLYKNHFLPPKGEIIGVACAEKANYAWDRKGNLYSWGVGSHLELGHEGEEEVLFPRIIPYFQIQKVFVAAIVTGGWHCIGLEGEIKNFQHRHLDLGQRIPKCLERLPKLRED